MHFHPMESRVHPDLVKKNGATEEEEECGLGVQH